MEKNREGRNANAESEQKEIYNLCIDNLNYEDSLDRLQLIQSSFFEYLIENKNLNLNTPFL